MPQNIQAHGDGEQSGEQRNQILFVPHKLFGAFLHKASLNSILLLLLSIFLSAVLPVSLQRHLEYIVDINHSTVFSHLISTKPVAVFSFFFGHGPKRF